MKILGNEAEESITKIIDQLMGLFFSQGSIAILIMMLENPINWNGAKDRQKTLDDIFHNEKVIKYNRAYLELFPLIAEDLLGKSPADFYSFDLDMGKNIWGSLLDNGRHHIDAYEQRSGLWLEGEIVGIHDKSGLLIGHITAIWELTYKKEYNTGKDRLLNKITEFRFMQKKDGTASFPSVSDEFKEIFDLNPHDVLYDAHAFFDRVFFADFDRLMASIEQSLNNLSMLETEFRINHPSKGQRWIKSIARPDKLTDGSIVWHGYFSDITENKKTEEWIGFLSTVLSNISDSVIISNNIGEIIYANQSASKLHGYEIDELLGKSPTMLNVNPVPDQEFQKIIKALYEGRTYLGEAPSRRKDGSIFTCEYTMTAIFDDNGTMTACIGIQRDITERKNMMEALLKSNKRFEQLTKQSKAIAWEIDKNSLITYISNGIQDVLGYKPEEIVGKSHFGDFLSPPHRVAVQSKIEKIFNEKKDLTDFFYPAVRKSGENAHLVINGMPIVNDSNDVTGYHVLSIDITEKVEMALIIENEKERYQTTLLSVGDGVISTDDFGNITVMNPVAEKLTGWTQEKAIGKPLSEVFVIMEDETEKIGENPAKAVFETKASVKSVDPITLVSASGAKIPIVNNAAPIISNSGQITGTVIVFRDFSEYMERQKQIEFLSFRDPLTGLYNRRYMEETKARMDSAKNLPLTIMILDVNGLKLTNDAFGHKAGDELLKTVADILKSVCRANDVCARVGGDEFFILLPHTDENSAEKIKQRIIKASMKAKLDSVVVSLAIGYAIKSSMKENIDHTIINADNLMYREKLKFGKTMRNETIETVLRNINFKYDKEQIHTERVSQYCEAIAVAMGMSEKEISDTKIAASLHDIGKIMVPPELLNKPGKLTNEEYTIIKRHPETGYQILRSVDEYVTLAKYLLYHHEHWDGKGYPEGLSGDAIPLQARIIAVADAYEAMTAARPYQKTRTAEEAKAELKRCAGTQFDPEIVNIFLEKVLG